MKTIVKYVPFAILITLNVIAQLLEFDLDKLWPFAIGALGLMVVNFIMASKWQVKTHFVYGLSSVMVIGALMVWLSKGMGQLFVEHVLTSMYIGLFLVTIIPPLFKWSLFTYEFSERGYPSIIVKSNQFYKINLVLNYIWAGLFLAAIVLSLVHYSNDFITNTVLASAIPVLVLLVVGIPTTLRLPDYLTQKISGKPIEFTSVQELFVAMPFGLNRAKAKGVDTVIQFQLTGQEPTTGFLQIQNQQCIYTNGEHPNPDTTIKCDSKLWLDISNNKIAGDVAYINHQYEVEGDATIMTKFTDMFAPPGKESPRQVIKPVTYDYKRFAPKKIKNIVVFDGGYRTNKNSKTTFMVNHFIEGAKEAGANVEYFKLRKLDIKDCTGCFTCWTKTPGACIFNDDMTILRKKYREADLIIFASPLYIFNVSGILKTFMDRLLPVLKPYMLMNDDGNILHPDRYPEQGQQGFLVFSASGFPEVRHNFDGMTGMFRAWDSHNENTHLMGEFYLPAAEMITHPIYKERKDLIVELCTTAGKQVVEKGFIEKELMAAIQDPLVSKKTFQRQADAFWANLDGKKSFMRYAPKLNYKITS